MFVPPCRLQLLPMTCHIQGFLGEGLSSSLLSSCPASLLVSATSLQFKLGLFFTRLHTPWFLASGHSVQLCGLCNARGRYRL